MLDSFVKVFRLPSSQIHFKIVAIENANMLVEHQHAVGIAFYGGAMNGDPQSFEDLDCLGIEGTLVKQWIDAEGKEGIGDCDL